MSIIFADFPSGQLGIYGTVTANMLNGIWAEVTNSIGSGYTPLVADPDPGIGSAGVVLYADGNSGSSANGFEGARFALPAEVTTLGVGFRLWPSKLPTDATHMPFISFRTNANVDILTLRMTTTGQLQAATGTDNGNAGSTVATSTGPVIVANSWQHVEIKATKGAGTGALEVRVNGVTIASLTLAAQAFSASNIAQIFIGTADGSGSSDGTMIGYFKDLIIWNTLGATGNNFQGSVSVRDLYTNADISLNWTPSTGATGWDLIDETTPNDADYIASPTAATPNYVAGLTNLPADVTSVRALIPINRSTKTDGGDCNLQIGLTPNNVNWTAGADTPLTTAFTYRWDVSELSPVTAAAWTPAEVNAAYVRADRTL